MFKVRVIDFQFIDAYYIVLLYKKPNKAKNYLMLDAKLLG